MKLALASAAFFAIACCLPALEFSKGGAAKDVLSGINVLVVGWSGIFAGVFGWYANPVWLLGLVTALVGRPKQAAIGGGVAFVIGCSTFLLFGRELPADEGGVTHMMLVRTLPGCYFWLASFAILPLGLLLPKER